MNYPEYVEIDGKKYKINTDFRVAIECNEIAQDLTIKDYERALAIIYKLFGEEGLNDFDNHAKLLTLGQRYLSCGKELKTEGKPDMDYKQDMGLIEISFLSDYHIDLANTKMHWWKFNEAINGLSSSELGNCCILNKIRSIRNRNLNEIKDNKEKEEIKKLQELYALKKYQKEIKMTEEQRESAEAFNKLLGL